MSAAARQARYERFAADFLRPLLEGGEVQVGRPLPPGDLEHFALASSSDLEVDQAIYSALHRTASIIAPVKRIPYPDRGTLALAMAGHNLVFITDPHLDRAFSRGARPEILAWADALIEAADAPRTRSEVLSRHAIVNRLLLLAREDVTVKIWAATYHFQGREVPRNVVAMPRLRRVRKKRERHPLLELFSAVDESTPFEVQPSFEALLARSPITELFHLEGHTKLRLGGAALAALADPSIAAGVARRVVNRGLAGAVTTLGGAVRRLHEDGAPPAMLAVAIGFVVRVFRVDAESPQGSTDLDALLSSSADARVAQALYSMALEDVDLFTWLTPSDGSGRGDDTLADLLTRAEWRHDDETRRLARTLIDATRPALQSSPSSNIEEARP